MTLFSAFAILFVLQAQPAPAKGSIEGMVIRAGTNEPISRTKVTVFRSDIPAVDRIPLVVTDDKGHFVIRDVDAGLYSLNAERIGYARGNSQTVRVRAGETVKDVIVRLTPGGAISGRVVDATGEPLLHVAVTVLRAVYDDQGRRHFNSVGDASTDDRGEYRVYLLPPGRYYVRAAARQGIELLNSVYKVTYYPGATDFSTASVVQVEPGAELTAIDFTLREERVFKVRGRLIDPKPAAQELRLIERDSEDYPISVGSADYNSETGLFEIGNVSPGAYWVQALQVGFRGVGGAPFGPGGQSVRVARAAVNITDSNVDGIQLVFAPDVSIAGRIVLDDGRAFADVRELKNSVVEVVPKNEFDRASPFPSKVAADGTFTIENIQVGEYRIRTEKPPQYYLKSVRLGQSNVSESLAISAPVSDELELVLASDSGEIGGTVLDKDGKTVAGVPVVLIPNSQRNRSDLYQFDKTDQNGEFRLSPAVPGDYKLFAWEDIGLSFRDPDFLRVNEAFGQPVKVSEFSKQTVVVRIIPAKP
jgi:Carboxypeptidase regulatory-like domain